MRVRGDPVLSRRRGPSAAWFLILVGLKFTAVNVILVDLDVRVPLLRQIGLCEDCRHRTNGHTGTAVNALGGIDIQLRHFVVGWSAIVISSAFRRMDTIHRAHVHTRGVLRSDAGLGNNVCHRVLLPPISITQLPWSNTRPSHDLLTPLEAIIFRPDTHDGW